MPFLRFAFLVLLLFWKNTPANGLEATSISKDAENRAVAATVRIYVKEYSFEDYTFNGSGFFVSPHLIATNFHVIEYKDTQRAWPYIAYSHSGGDLPNPVKRVKVFNVKYDLAVLEVSRSNVKPLTLGRSETVERLNKVYVVGYPLGLDCGTTSGEINNPKQLYKEVEYIRFDAAVSPGNSGGPVLDTQGYVIGVATRGSWIIAQNINFAVPSNHLWSLLYRDGIRLTREPKPVDPEEEERRQAAEANEKITKHLKAATVRIIGKAPNGEESLLGMGFFVEPNQVATDFHVVDGAELIGVKHFRQGTKSADVLLGAKLLKKDKMRHLAILEVEKKEAKPLSLGNSGKVDRDDKIYMVQDPSQGKISEGTISKILDIDGVLYFQLDAEVLPASSGGPIANTTGEVIAVTALKVPILDGSLNYAIPAIYLEGLRAKPPDPPPTDPRTEPPHILQPDDGPDPEPKVIPAHENLLKSGIDFYKAAQFREAVEHLQSTLSRLSKPNQLAEAHLYLGFSKWGLEDTKSSVSAEFREALRYNPSVTLPDDVGQDHPVFKPLLEKARQESTGILTITASPPETEVWIFGGEMKPQTSWLTGSEQHSIVQRKLRRRRHHGWCTQGGCSPHQTE